jgi:hypothetical protein
MNPPSETPQTATTTIRPNLEKMVIALGHKRRWKILKELSVGDSSSRGRSFRLLPAHLKNGLQVFGFTGLTLSCETGFGNSLGRR